jgi:high affinity Mn2+ porin
MNGAVMVRLLYSSLALIALAICGAARGADLYVKAPAPPPNYDWSGFYGGVLLGFSSGHASWTAGSPGGPNIAGTFDFFRGYDPFDGSGSQFGGLAAVYNFMFRPDLLVGIEADLSAPSTFSATQSVTSAATGAANFSQTVEMFGTLRARAGLDHNHWLYYVTGGLAWSYDQFTRTQDGPGGTVPAGTVETTFLGRLGWTIGAGIEAPVVPGWSARLEYLYSQFGSGGVNFAQNGQRFASDLSIQQIRLGLNYRFWDPQQPSSFSGPTPIITDGWALHGQTTYVSQYAPPFHAPYSGANSLESNAGRETWDATAYVGHRLWEGAELWINPEIDQGFGLSNTLGIAGFTSGEAYKVGSSYPYLRVPRYFIRQTIDLGGESEKVEDDINQFSRSQTANRLVITVGKFSVPDIFDSIRYAHDPRNDFLNWSLLDAGTFDYAADAWGFTYGAAVEWYQGNWALRTGLFDLSIVPNSTELDPTFRQFQFVYELEHRHELWGQPGKLALAGFLSRGGMGTFADALAYAQQNGTVPNTADVRRYQSRPGVNVNFEQQVVENVGVFGRFGWADGNIEPYEFTDIDRTASLGMSLGGKLWSRPDDTIGIAGVANGISAIHAAYLNAGGLGILVGDGQLPHPGYEQIVETYYSLPLGAWKLTADYQFIANPGYNRDRGPVSVISGRLRTQF